MAHGLPIYHICETCDSFILNGRFSPTPICPSCKNKSKQITREGLKLLLNLTSIYKLPDNYNVWKKLKQ